MEFWTTYKFALKEMILMWNKLYLSLPKTRFILREEHRDQNTVATETSAVWVRQPDNFFLFWKSPLGSATAWIYCDTMSIINKASIMS